MRKVNIIFATAGYDQIFGANGGLPWTKEEGLEDLKHFNRITTDTFVKNVIVSGRKTYESLSGPLKDREHVIISKNIENGYSSLDDFMNNLEKYENRKIFIIGGAKLIEEVYKKYFNLIDTIYYTFIDKEFQNYEHDNTKYVFFDQTILNDMLKYVVREKKSDKITFHEIKIPNHEEFQYLNLIEECIKAKARKTRNAVTRSIFNRTITFDLNEGFPLLTTKKVFLRGVFEELMFFLKGQTNSKILEEKGVNIWKPNTTKEFIESCNLPYSEGDMGPMYGYNWRHFGATYKGADHDYTNQGYDQLKYVIDLLIKDPHSRRILMTTYDPSTSGQGVLYPCHSIVIQFYVENGVDLSMNMYQRSVDVACGLPFNIASNALLLCIVAKMTNLIPNKLNIIMGDIHVYDSHIENLKVQLNRTPFKFCKLNIKSVNKEITDYKFEDLELIDYQHHPAIKFEMVA
jgi:thymidylate synthase/dihydrofolate reductase